jgi:hypothetical protein
MSKCNTNHKFLFFFWKQNSLQEARWNLEFIFGGLGVTHSQRVFPFKHLWEYMDVLVGFETWFQVSFSFSNDIKSEDIRPTMVVQCLDFHLQFQLDVIPTTTFDLWMSRGQHDTFVFFIKNLFANWKPQYVTITFLKPMILLGMFWQGNWRPCLRNFVSPSKSCVT